MNDIVIQQNVGTATPSLDSSTTVSDILTCTSQDVRGVLNPFTGVSQTTDQKILVDYTNRISLDLLRHSRYTFLLSAPQTFSTVATAANTTPVNNLYWVGPSGQAPAGTIDTGLNLTDFDILKQDEVIDYTNNRRISKSDAVPVGSTFQQPSRPKNYVLQPDRPNVIQLWPPPNGVYTITFRYYKSRNQLVDPSQVIQIPDRYKDIVCHGVTWLAFQYIKSYPEDVQAYSALYERGKTQIIKDMNLFPRGGEYIHPDPSSVVLQTTTGIGLDSGIETSIP